MRTHMVCAWMLAVVTTLPAAEVASDDFYRLIRNDDFAGLKALLTKGADVNMKDSRGATPLMYAAASGSAEVMKLLLDAGADVNARNSFGASALLWSAGEIRKVRLLLDKGAEVNVATKQGRTPLLAAATYDGGEEVVKLLISKGADVKAVEGFQFTALGLAAGANDTDLVRFLIAKGLDPNPKTVPGLTPLMAAAAQDNLPMVKLLLAKGADVNAASTSGGKVKNGDIALKKLTPLMLAASYSSPELIATLLDAGANVNAKDIRGMTPLMLAAASENQDARVIALLLKRGADPDLKSEVGETALDWARKFGDPAVLKLLHGQPLSASPADRPLTSTDLRIPISKGLSLLQRSSTEFFKQSGCVGCHHQNLTAMAVRSARDKGLSVDENSADEQLKMVKFEWTGRQDILLQRIEVGGGADTVSYSLAGLAAANYPADATTDAMVFSIAGTQRRDGSWRAGGISRHPMEGGEITRTAMSMHALQLYGAPARKLEFDERIARARDWLLAAKAKTTEDRNMQILGLKWAGAAPATIEGLSKALLAEQRGDGGWSQNPNLPSDAYATGEALYALHHAAGLPTRDAAFQRGVQFLLKTQLEDGSWHVSSRAPKFQPYFQSGFPHDHDQWISSAATSWASMALAAAIEPTASPRAAR
jgi:ankyrin repeat protein